MLVKGKGRADAKLLHDDEGNAICQGISFVLMLLEICPPCPE
jgi:hypothetical protein